MSSYKLPINSKPARFRGPFGGLAKKAEATKASGPPAEIFGADLVGWYRADDIVLTGGKVSQWNDRSGNNNHATQGTDSLRPTIATAAVNGKDAVRFDNLDRWLSLPNFLQSSWGEASTFIVLTIKDQDQHWDAMRTGSSSNSYWGSNSTFNYAGYFGEYRSSRLPAQPPDMTTTGTHLIEVISGVGTGNYNISKNGINIYTGNPSWGITSAPRIGRGPDTKRMNGDIGEIIIVKRAATIEEQTLIRNYISSYWGLTL